VYIDFFPEVLV